MGDIIFVRDENDTKVTMRSKIENEVKAPIVARFEEAQVRLSTMPQSLADNKDVVKLQMMLRNNTVDTLIVPAADRLKDDPDYSALFLDPRGSAGSPENG